MFVENFRKASRAGTGEALLAGLVLAVMAVPARAQGGVGRTNFVFHVYVDPIFGDNAEAIALNPGNREPDPPNGINTPVAPMLHDFYVWQSGLGPPFERATRPRPLDTRQECSPWDSPNSPSGQGISGYIQHAPYSFRTLTGEWGAIEYVNSLFSKVNPNGPQLPHVAELPWTNPATGLTVAFVVIHCLPGLYGPAAFEGEIDPESGLPWNGEDFPVLLGGRTPGGDLGPSALHDRVSIQGTSALDTVFDARGSDAALTPMQRTSDIIQVWTGGAGLQRDNAFIDGITIRGARSVIDVSSSGTKRHCRGIGIHIMGHASIARIRITNCFFIDNLVGVGIDSFGWRDGLVDRFGVHEPVIINNTFYDNFVGLWSGMLATDTPPPTSPYVNNHNPLMVNNLFYASNQEQDDGSSAFEGVWPQSQRVRFHNGQVLPTQDQRDYNAWYAGRANRGVSLSSTPNWVIAQTGFIALPAPEPPRVNTQQYGSLLVREVLQDDVFHNDLRITPFARQLPSAVPNVPNPLIGAGINFPAASVGTNGSPMLANDNGALIISAPGLPLNAEDASVHGWDYDCEGFGNPRIEPMSGAAPGSLGSIDIGADQCAKLIMAGYVPNTRMYCALSPSMPEVPGGAYNKIYYIGQPGSAGHARPDANSVIGFLPWSENVRQEPLPLPASPYYNGLLSTSNYTAGWAQVIYQPFPQDPITLRSFRRRSFEVGSHAPFMRNLPCDFSPHLLHDAHPWGGFFDALGLTFPLPELAFDPYSAHPDYCEHELGELGLAWDNPLLFYNVGQVPHGAPPMVWFGLSGYNGGVVAAHINPPGAGLRVLPSPYRYVLDGGSGPPSQFGPLSDCGGVFQPLISFDAMGVSVCPDIVPDNGWDLGVRVDCELRQLSPAAQVGNNLQTFLVVLTDVINPNPWSGLAASAPRGGAGDVRLSEDWVGMIAGNRETRARAFMAVDGKIGREWSPLGVGLTGGMRVLR